MTEPAITVVATTSASRKKTDRKHSLRKPSTLDWNDFALAGSTVSAYSKRVEKHARNQGLRGRVNCILASKQFDMGIGFIILLNSITVGIESEQSVKGEPTPILSGLEHVFLCIYIIELGARIFVDHMDAFKENWVRFDAVLVSVGIITNWIVAPLAGSIDLGPVMVLRVGRLFRLVRAVRLLLVFRELWMLARGLIHSLPIMVYTMLMILIILYIFSCMAVEIISKHEALDSNAPEDEEFKRHVQKYFPGLMKSMLSLVQFVSADSMASVYLPLVEKDGYLMLYFGAVILVVSVVLTNLITAVVVNSALDAAAEDGEFRKKRKKQEHKKMMKALKAVFESIDDDNSGEITMEELIHVTDEEREKFEALIPLTKPEEVFRALDLDNSGQVTQAEFCEGVWRLSNGETSIPLIEMKQSINELAETLDANQETLSGVSTNQSILFEKLEDTQRQVSQILKILERDSDSPVILRKDLSDMPAWAQRMTSRFSSDIEAMRAMLSQASPASLSQPNGSSAKHVHSSWQARQDSQGAELLSACADADVTIMFQPGPIGMTSRESCVKDVAVGGQAHRRGVAPGWMIKAVDGRKHCDFDDELLQRSANGNNAYEITFATQATPAWASRLSDQLVREVELIKSSLYDVILKIPRTGGMQYMHEKHLLVLPDVPSHRLPARCLNDDDSRKASGRSLNGCSFMPGVCAQPSKAAATELPRLSR